MTAPGRARRGQAHDAGAEMPLDRARRQLSAGGRSPPGRRRRRRPPAARRGRAARARDRSRPHRGPSRSRAAELARSTWRSVSRISSGSGMPSRMASLAANRACRSALRSVQARLSSSTAAASSAVTGDGRRQLDGRPVAREVVDAPMQGGETGEMAIARSGRGPRAMIDEPGQRPAPIARCGQRQDRDHERRRAATKQGQRGATRTERQRAHAAR